MMIVGSPSLFARLGVIIGSGIFFLLLQQGGLDAGLRQGIFWSLRPGLAAAKASSELYQASRSMVRFVQQGGQILAAAENELATTRVNKQLLRDLEKENSLLRLELGRENDQAAVFRLYGGGGRWFIDGGCRQKVLAQAPVYYQESLVGQITRRETSYSEVQTVLDQDFRQPVKVGSGSARGLFQNARGVPEVLDLPLKSAVRLGDAVLTEGLGAMPPDKILGQVSRVAANSSTGTLTAEIEPYFPPDQVEWVSVPVSSEEEPCSD